MNVVVIILVKTFVVCNWETTKKCPSGKTTDILICCMEREIWLLIHKISLNYIIFKMLHVITSNKIVHAENILYMLI